MVKIPAGTFQMGSSDSEPYRYVGEGPVHIVTISTDTTLTVSQKLRGVSESMTAPWTRRPIFGSIRYMNESGLKRKFDMEAYIENISNMCADNNYELDSLTRLMEK